MVPSAERRAHPFPPVETLLPASVDRFPCFHTCPAYEPQPSAKRGETSSNIFYLVATSMISAVPANTHFADGALVLRGAEKTYVGPRRRCL